MALYFINRYFYPDQSATSQLLTDLAVALADGGHPVTVITSRQSYAVPDLVYPAQGSLHGVRIVRIWTTRYGRRNLPGRALDYATFYMSLVWALLRLIGPQDVIIAKTDPPMLSVVVAPLARLRGAKLVNWLQDLYPEVAEVIGVGPRAFLAPIYRLAKPLRDRSLKPAECNVVLGEVMADRLEKLGVAPAKIRIIPNWADGGLLKPIPEQDNALRHEWGLQQRFVAGYSGNLGRAHEYQTLLEAMAQIAAGVTCEKDELRGPQCDAAGSPAFGWLFVGGGALYEGLRRDVDARGLSHVVFKPYQPRECLAQSLSAADVHLVSLREDLEGLIVPSKFYAIAAVGRPTIFIGSPQGEIARILQIHECGLTVPQGDGTALAAALLRLARDPGERARLGANARRAFETTFDKPLAINAWRKLLTEVGDQAT